MKEENKNATQRSLKRKSRPTQAQLPYNVWCEQSQKMCVKSCLEDQILPYVTPLFYIFHMECEQITSASGEVERMGPSNLTITQTHIYCILPASLCASMCSHRDTLFMAIPGIFKACFFIALRGSWGLAEKEKEFLWPMWNSTACISLYTPARTHTQTDTPHIFVCCCELHIHNYKCY